MTRTGVAAGTPAYMAPEQFEDVKGVDVRADIYSFGVMLYQMTAGRLPFAGRTWQEYERLHRSQFPPVLPALDRELRNLIEVCLAKDPAERFGDFIEIRHSLAQIYRRLTGEGAPEPATGTELDKVRLHNKGLSLERLGRLEEAIACFDRMLEINPSDGEAWFDKGVALDKLGRSEEAIVHYDRALKIDPRDSKAWTNKAIALVMLERVEEAHTCFDHAIELDPRNEHAWLNKGVTLSNHGRIGESLACFDRALQLNPNYELAWYNKGVNLKHLGRIEEALSC